MSVGDHMGRRKVKRVKSYRAEGWTLWWASYALSGKGDSYGKKVS